MKEAKEVQGEELEQLKQKQEEKPEENQEPQGEESEKTEKSTESEKTEEKSKEFQTIDAQKKRWREKALKAEEELKKVKKPAVPESEDFWKTKVEFLLQHRDISDDEFDHIANVASNKGISLGEAKKQEDEYIQFRRKKVADENKTPAPSSSGSGSSSKEITSETSKAEMDAIYLKKMKKADQGENAGV